MILVVAEKAIAAQRISSILAGKNIAPLTEKNAKYFLFERADKQFAAVPLKGHVVDVDFPQQYSYWLGTDLKRLVKADIEYKPTEKQIIDFLKKIAPNIEEAIIATDNDREGESIGFEAINALKEKNPSIKVKRALFSAITPKDITAAFNSLGEADKALSDSADARREIDLVWGAVLTRFLSLVSGRLGKEFLSMGRVQGPTLALIVDREKERLAFKPRDYWEIAAIFSKDKNKFEALHKKGRFWEKEEAEKAMKCAVPPIGKVVNVEKRRRILERPLPFNTTSFLAAATAIGFAAGKAMSVAESLYQNGLISYPRTDNTVYPPSLNLKEIVLELCKVSEIKKSAEKILSLEKIIPSYGKETKDHPPIHPVAAVEKERLTTEQWKIYKLVCSRFLATLGEDAIAENVLVEIDLNGEPFISTGQTFVKMGWKELYPYSKATEIVLPLLAKGDIVKLVDLNMLSKQTMPKPRYSQGRLITLMAQLNLGTKSTRAEIIQKLFARRYIFGRKAIEPNKIAFAVIDSLEKYDGMVVKPAMTAELEQEMDLVAAAKKSKRDVVEESKQLLEKILEQLLLNKNDIGTLLRKAILADSIVGSCPAENCKGELLIRRGRTGKRFLGCSNYPKCTVSYPLPQHGAITPLQERCKECGNIMISVKGKRGNFKMCVDVNCPSKKSWGKKK